jgi:nicotinamidase-related amidase
MQSSKTLREVSGLANKPPSLADSALIMIDCQNTYRRGIMQLVNVEPALAEAKLLLERARAEGARIFHIRHDAGPGSPYDITAAIGQISDEVAPRQGEPIITKNYPNAFIHTDLEQQLRAAGVSKVVLAGFMTHMCINSTARGAFNLGFEPTVVAAATATRNLPSADGAVVSAEALQAASLAAVGDLFAIVVGKAADLQGAKR